MLMMMTMMTLAMVVVVAAKRDQSTERILNICTFSIFRLVLYYCMCIVIEAPTAQKELTAPPFPASLPPPPSHGTCAKLPRELFVRRLAAQAARKITEVAEHTLNGVPSEVQLLCNSISSFPPTTVPWNLCEITARAIRT